MDIINKAKRMRDIGNEYENLLNELLNFLFKIIPECIALEMEDSLIPVYSTSVLKTKGILAFPYKCKGEIGYIVLTQEGIFFEIPNGESRKIYSF
ncbi:hypothetical protein CM19_09970 [Candidatus Acidianus copahuensis]|uniref:Uncharacterized protein n=1 Tax=Candidatus Acidianus copahuensis TaxID=1160895 RepID=A0A031LMN1_9CREN|nr:hypothetical protein [Candidatus Acidianus copahuensis]EZQ03145.1 hypothetical protein CM19_09970 [Candidatus Acidianus copahuensis]